MECRGMKYPEDPEKDWGHEQPKHTKQGQTRGLRSLAPWASALKMHQAAAISTKMEAETDRCHTFPSLSKGSGPTQNPLGLRGHLIGHCGHLDGTLPPLPVC